MIKTFKRSFLEQYYGNLYKVEKENPSLNLRVVPKEAVIRKLHPKTAISPAHLSISSNHPLNSITSSFLKRSFDVFFSVFVLLFILSWLVPIIAVLIKLESKGPVFFKQLRTGKDDEPFLCYKFRSLRMNDEADKKQVTSNDKRVTKIGRFMRKTSIDELPQFFNVLLGHMSIVGPRPHMIKHTEEFSGIVKNYRARHLVKPGVTGLAQISGYRGEILHNDQLIRRVEKDFKYISTWNLILDLKIIFLTVYKSIAGDQNAY